MHPTGYTVGIYRNQDTCRSRWAVVGPANAWIFPTGYGKAAAKRLCLRLNKIEMGPQQ